jgi:hypothetical protein
LTMEEAPLIFITYEISVAEEGSGRGLARDSICNWKGV